MVVFLHWEGKGISESWPCAVHGLVGVEKCIERKEERNVRCSQTGSRTNENRFYLIFFSESISLCGLVVTLFSILFALLSLQEISGVQEERKREREEKIDVLLRFSISHSDLVNQIL